MRESKAVRADQIIDESDDFVSRHNLHVHNLVPRVSHLTTPWGDQGETLGTRLTCT